LPIAAAGGVADQVGDAPAAVQLAVIVTTYNKPAWLDAVLRCLDRQSDRAFEVVVADDGSTRETTALIRGWQATAGFALGHAWQPDTGFRAGEARNRAVAASTARYLVFLDGDCLPFADFIAQHRALAQPGWFVRGNRVLLSPHGTEAVLARVPEAPLPRSWHRWLGPRLRGELNRVLPLMPLAPLARATAHQRDWRGAKTCNLAVWRDDFVAVNGFDHAFTGWGLEDTDLVLRLFAHGVRRRDGAFRVPVLHCHHQERSRDHLPENQARLAAMLAERRVRAPVGLAELEPVPPQADALPAGAPST
jgi:glycosyltransferase involved in cell wall biosynthesis